MLPSSFGTGANGSLALGVGHDGVEELKLLWNTSDDEIERAIGFLERDMDVRALRRD